MERTCRTPIGMEGDPDGIAVASAAEREPAGFTLFTASGEVVSRATAGATMTESLHEYLERMRPLIQTGR